MEGSCGPAKMPMGLGKFEAEAVAQGLSPTLMLLLERRGPARELAPADVSLEIGDEGASVRLEPMVEPRRLAVQISGEGLVTHKQLVRTQIEMELCLEHKVGRGWVGQDAASLRQAFLLDPPAERRIDRLAFSGQRNPVPALTGPTHMTTIKTIRSDFYRIPLPVVLTDSTHGAMKHFELIAVRVVDSDGAQGCGYTYTVGAGGGGAR